MDSDTEEELESKNMLRYDLYYLIQKLTKILGFMKVYNVVVKRMDETVVMLGSQKEYEHKKVLAKLEAELYVLSGALKKVNENDPEIITAMQRLLAYILGIEFQKQKLLYTALKIIARSSAFFGSNSDLLQQAFKFLASCIREKKFENIAAEAISNLCKSNRGFVLQNLDDFVQCTL